MPEPSDAEQSAHYRYLLTQIEQFRLNPKEYVAPAAPMLPDGQPIGCGEE
ncbi:MAG: hypothetical protein JNK77_07140 [Saprospiraceae bacterium]|nr:hypothetical protein [Saprospiraceae bacterium]